MADFFGVDQKVVTEWILDPTGATTGINKVAKEIRKQEALERNLNKIHETLGKSTETLGNKFTAMAKSQALAFAKGQLLVGGLNMAKEIMVEGVKAAEAYGIAQRNFTGDLEAAKRATEGQVDALTLMQSKNKLDTLGIQMSSQEYSKFAGNVKKLAEVMGEDLGKAMDDAATALARKSVMIADNLGLVIKAGDDFQEQFLEQLEDKAAAAAASTNTLSKELRKLYNEVKNLATEGAAAVNESGGFMNALFYLKRGAAGTGQPTLAQMDALAQAEASIAAFDSGFTGGTADPYAMAFGKRSGAGGTGFSGLGMDPNDPLRNKGAALRPWGASGKGSGKQARGVAGVDFHPGKEVDVRGWLEEQASIERNAEATRIAAEMKREWSSTHTEATQAAIAQNEAEMESLQKKIDGYQRAADSYKKLNNEIQDFAHNGLAALATGQIQAAAAAITGAQSYSEAGRQMLAESLKQIGQLAGIKAGLAFADWAMSWFMDGSKAIAFAGYSAVALAAGAGAQGLSSGNKAGGKGKSGGTQQAAPRQISPGFGRNTRADQPLTINVYIGDPDDPSAALLAKRQLQTTLQGDMGGPEWRQ